MSYKPTNWQDDIYDEESGELIQEGTPMSRPQFFNMETGIFAGNVLGLVLLQELLQVRRNVADLEGELIEVQLTNSQKYPFNNSTKTIAFSKERDALTYEIGTEVLSANGPIGEVEVFDKALNGCKVKFTGSATAATIRCYIRGGMK